MSLPRHLLRHPSTPSTGHCPETAGGPQGRAGICPCEFWFNLKLRFPVAARCALSPPFHPLEEIMMKHASLYAVSLGLALTIPQLAVA